MAQINGVNVTPVSSFSNAAMLPGDSSWISPTIIPSNAPTFLVGHNTLTGAYELLRLTDGWLSQDQSNSEGYFDIPQQLSLVFDEPVDLFGMRLVGNEYEGNYPTDLKITYVNSGGTATTESFINMTDAEQVMPFSATKRDIVKIDFLIYRISAPHKGVSIRNIYNLLDLTRVDGAIIHTEESSLIIDRYRYQLQNYVIITEGPEQSKIKGFLKSSDTANLQVENTSSSLVNAHEVLRRPTRRVFVRVYITYVNPMLDNLLSISYSEASNDTVKEQLLDGLLDVPQNNFTCYLNNLTGTYKLSSLSREVGWTSAFCSLADKSFIEDPWISLEFSARLLWNLKLSFDHAGECYPEEFQVSIFQEGSTDPIIYKVYGFNQDEYLLTDSYSEVYKIEVKFYKTSRPFNPIVLNEFSAMSQILYTEDEVISLDFLEELTFDDKQTTLGNCSSNEVVVTLDNKDKEFFYNNTQSKIRNQLKKNRKIVPWMGVQFSDKIEWHRLGTFWSDQWTVPVESLTASVVGYDTLYLLDKLSFYDHQVYQQYSVKQLAELILVKAKEQFSSLEWNIADTLNDLIIPYAWFANSSFTQALKRLSSAGLINLYCDRAGKIVLEPRRTDLTKYTDVWASTTNIISTKYPSLYTLLPNRINVTVTAVSTQNGSLLFNNNPVVVTSDAYLQYDFSSPYCGTDLQLTVDCTAGVTYTAEVFSWGLILHVSGNGTLNSINALGTSLKLDTNMQRYAQDVQRIQEDGLQQVGVSHDFIQTSEYAQSLAEAILQVTSDDKYYAEVEYLGDPVDTLNDIIKLDSGIAPINQYILSRNKLFYDGSLTGQATLIT